MLSFFSSNVIEWDLYLFMVSIYTIVVCLPLAITYLFNKKSRFFKKQISLSFVIFLLLALGDSIAEIEINYLVWTIIFVNYALSVISLIKRNETL